MPWATWSGNSSIFKTPSVACSGDRTNPNVIFTQSYGHLETVEIDNNIGLFGKTTGTLAKAETDFCVGHDLSQGHGSHLKSQKIWPPIWSSEHKFRWVSFLFLAVFVANGYHHYHFIILVKYRLKSSCLDSVTISSSRNLEKMPRADFLLFIAVNVLWQLYNSHWKSWI